MQLLLLNGNLLTMDPARPRAEALLAEDGRLRVVGTNAEARAAAESGAEVVDLRGRTVLPGFNDAHCHVLVFGMNLNQVDLKHPGVPSITVLTERITERVAVEPPGTWIRGFGYDNNKLIEDRHPTRTDLDAVAPSHPIVVKHTSGHMLVANSVALRLAGVDRSTPDPAGGHVVRDEHGEPTGLLQETAQRLINDAIPPPTVPQMRRALRLASDRLAEEGITSFQDACVGMTSTDEVSAWQAASESGELHQRASLILGVEHVFPPERSAGPRFGLGLRSGFGDERLRIGGVKIFADGSLIGRTAAMEAPFLGEADNCGMLTVPEDDLRRTMLDAHQAGWQLSIHAIGDRAVRTVLDAYAAALQAHPKQDHRHRIEHCGVLTPPLIERIAALGLIPITQPRFITELGDGFIRAIGRERAALCYPLASLVRRGIPVAGSSDRPVVEGAPLLGIHDAVNQVTGSGEPYATREALSPEEAIRLFTLSAAFAALEDRHKGSLAPGKLADFVVLEADPTAIPKVQIATIPVVATFIGAEPIYVDGHLFA